jgi:hypothetical protein
MGVSQAGQTKTLSVGLTLMASAAADSAAATEARGGEETSLAPKAVPVTGADETDGGALRSGETDECLRLSDSHFSAGRQLYFEGASSTKLLMRFCVSRVRFPITVASNGAWMRSVT